MAHDVNGHIVTVSTCAPAHGETAAFFGLSAPFLRFIELKKKGTDELQGLSVSELV